MSLSPVPQMQSIQGVLQGSPPLADIPFFMIHLKRVVEREPLIRRLEEDLHHPMMILDAIDGKTDPRVAAHPRTHPFWMMPTELGGVAGLLSHIQLFRVMVERNLPYIGVFEDDAECTASVEMIDEFYAMANRTVGPWDVFFLGGTEWVKSAPITPTLVQVERFWGAHAYLVTQAAARHSIEDYEALANAGYAYPFDWHLAYTIQKHGLRAFGPFHPKQFLRQRPGLVSYITGKIRTYTD